VPLLTERNASVKVGWIHLFRRKQVDASSRYLQMLLHQQALSVVGRGTASQAVVVAIMKHEC
jgi:hypothetical protein